MTEAELREQLVGMGLTGKLLDSAIEIAKRENGPLTSPGSTPSGDDRPQAGSRCWQDGEGKWHHNPYMHQGCMLR